MKQSEIKRRTLLKFGAAAAVAAATVVRTEAADTTEQDLSGEPGTIRQQYTFNAPASKIWQALTEPSHLNNWFCLESSVTPGVGGTMRHSWGEPVLEQATIQAWEPNSRLRVVETIPFGITFQPSDGPSKQRTIQYTLAASGNKTVVNLEYSGFGTSPEWRTFQAAVAACEKYQVSALGHYAESHFGEQRTVAWARSSSGKTYNEMWSALTGSNGILTEGSFDGLREGDSYSVRAVTGDVFQGTVISHIPNKQFAGTVANLNNSLLRIVLDRVGPNEAAVWLASWGTQPAANQMFEQRWTHTLQKVLS